MAILKHIVAATAAITFAAPAFAEYPEKAINIDRRVPCRWGERYSGAYYCRRA